MARPGRPKKVRPQDNALPFPPETSRIVWFGRMESVVLTEDGRRSVFVGGTLIGSFGRKDRPVRIATSSRRDSSDLLEGIIPPHP